jgi:hypothetical protein
MMVIMLSSKQIVNVVNAYLIFWPIGKNEKRNQNNLFFKISCQYGERNKDWVR